MASEARGAASIDAILGSMRKEDLIAFARRDWEAIAESKRRRLRRHAIALHESWPTEEDRRNDLAMHIRVTESLRRVKPPGGR